MSYEGRIEHLCKNGHLYVTDCHNDDELCHCGESSVFQNQIDDTNCFGEGSIENWNDFLISPEKSDKCNLGHWHVIEHARYRVPKREELKRWYSPENDE